MKIEVGKKYLKRDRSGWSLVIFDRRSLNDPSAQDSHYPLLIVNSNGDANILTWDGREWEHQENRGDLVEEYRETINNSIKGWVGYNPNDNHSDISIGNKLLNCSASNYLMEKKSDVHGSWKSSIYGEFIFKQLPEPKE